MDLLEQLRQRCRDQATATDDGAGIQDFAPFEARLKNGQIQIHDQHGRLLHTLKPSERNKNLPPGEYMIKVVGADGVEVDTPEFTMKKRGEVAVRVRLLAPEAPRVAKWQPTAEQQAFFDHVKKLPPQEQVDAVREKLRELNPGFDGKVTHHFEDGRVVELNFITDAVTEIWPVRALAWLKTLRCSGTSEGLGTFTKGHGKLADLAPLAGLKLTYLNCRFTRVAHLSPLKDMPLSRLYCGDTRISDLSPLKGMGLTHLDFQGTAVSDLSHLKGMSLEHLHCERTLVSDFSPLKGMPLAYLRLGGTLVGDLSPLEGMPLKNLGFGVAHVTDLTPLRGMPLTYLHASANPLSDLSPLKGMRLTWLNIVDTQVADLSPLKDMPLASLYMFRSRVSDFSVLKNMPLLEIWLDFPLYDPAAEAVLKSLPLRTIGEDYKDDRPATKFWEAIALRRKAAEGFAAATAKLPAREQVAAVAAKLKEVNGDDLGRLVEGIENNAVTIAVLELGEWTPDITPLMAFTKLKKLTLLGGHYVSDISALKHLPLEELNVSDDIAHRNAGVLRAMATLKRINALSAADYWMARSGTKTNYALEFDGKQGCAAAYDFKLDLSKPVTFEAFVQPHVLSSINALPDAAPR
ncbi:MAG: hypothetical protein L0Y71_01600 [Gemmataceae bacterium]|nr:hypothetical protein [Gemmataceae bacterium]